MKKLLGVILFFGLVAMLPQGGPPTSSSVVSNEQTISSQVDKSNPSKLTAEEEYCIAAFVREFKGSTSLQKVAADSPFSLKTALGMMAAERCAGLGRKTMKD